MRVHRRRWWAGFLVLFAAAVVGDTHLRAPNVVGASTVDVSRAVAAVSSRGAASPIAQGGTRTCELGVGARETVLTASGRDALGLGGTWPDSIFGVQKQDAGYTFYASHALAAGGSAISRVSGTLENPAAASAQPAIPIQQMKHAYDYAGGGPVYQDPTSGTLLMFYHAERWSGGDPHQFWALYGMAKSTDGGNSWVDLGEIVTPEVPYSPVVPAGTPPNALSVPMPSAPFIMVGDYFYVYGKDRTSYSSPMTWLTVARARVDDVVRAAVDANTVVPWSKYYNGAWNEPGLGGRASSLEAGNPSLRQVDISYNEYLGQYVMVVIDGVAPDRDAVYFMESPDPLAWGGRQVIDEEPALKLYPTIVGLGDDPRTTGGQFYVYYPSETLSPDQFLVRRLVSCQPGARLQSAVKVSIGAASADGSRLLTGMLADGSGAPVVGAPVAVSITPLDGPGVVHEYTITGIVPADATQAVANLNFLRQSGGSGEVDFSFYEVRYSEAGGRGTGVVNGTFAQGMQGWNGGGGTSAVVASDNGPGSMLRVHAGPGETGLRTSAPFRVTPGTVFTASFTARVAPASVNTGFFGINFQDQSGKAVARDIDEFKAVALSSTVTTDGNGAFSFAVVPLAASHLVLQARYDGDNDHWYAYARSVQDTNH